MPLLRLDIPHYLNRKRLFIDADQRDTGLSESIWNGTYILNDFYTKIQSIELVSYNIPRFIMPTFVETSTDSNGNVIQGNNKLDIRLADVPETQSLTFTVTFPPGRYESIDDLKAIIPDLFESTMDAQGDPFFNTGAGVSFTTPVPGFTTAAQSMEIVSEIGGNNELITMEFLFGSGTNSDQSVWNVFGFLHDQDNGGYQLVNPGNALVAPFILYDPVPDSAATITPYRYVDIYIDEAPELSPVARVFMTDEKTSNGNYTTNDWIQNKPRLLKDLPIRKMNTITIRLVFENNIVPVEEFQCGYDLIFDLVLLVPEQTIPCWTKQQLTY